MADNEFEILDLTALRRRNEGWVHQIFGEVSRKTAAQQVVIGGASGWYGNSKAPYRSLDVQDKVFGDN